MRHWGTIWKRRHRRYTRLTWTSGAFVLVGVQTVMLLYHHQGLSARGFELSDLWLRDLMLGVEGRYEGALTSVLWINLLAVAALWAHLRGTLVNGDMRDFSSVFRGLSAATLLALLSGLIGLFPAHFSEWAIQGAFERNANGQYEYRVNPDFAPAHFENCGPWPPWLDGPLPSRH